MALDKLVDSAQLDDGLTSIADTIRTKGGTSAELVFPDGFVSAIEAIEAGSESGWKRPSEWPDYSKLRLAEDEIEALFYTFDNTSPPTWIGINCFNSVYDRVQIESDGSITVLEAGITGTDYTLTAEMGDYVCIRATPQSGKHITGANLEGVSSKVKSYKYIPCLERYGYLPYCTMFGIGYSYRDWPCHSVVSDTLLAVGNNVQFSEENSYNLENLDIRGASTFSLFNLNGCSKLKYLPPLSFSVVFNTTQNINPFRLDGVLAESLDLSGVDLSGVVKNTNSYPGGFMNCRNLKTIRMPSNMNNISVNTYDTFNGATAIEIIEFDVDFHPDGGVGTRFVSECANLKALIFRSSTLVPLNNTGGWDKALCLGGGNLYVPADLVESYKAATNWSIFANYIVPIEGSYWKTHHADGSLIEEEV